MWIAECAYYISPTVYPKKYAHGFCFAVLCCGYTLTDFPISIRLTSLALWQSNDCPSASKATLINMDKYFMWIHYERLHNHNKAKHNKTVCIFLGIYCIWEVKWEKLKQIDEVLKYRERLVKYMTFVWTKVYHPPICRLYQLTLVIVEIWTTDFSNNSCPQYIGF